MLHLALPVAMRGCAPTSGSMAASGKLRDRQEEAAGDSTSQEGSQGCRGLQEKEETGSARLKTQPSLSGREGLGPEV